MMAPDEGASVSENDAAEALAFKDQGNAYFKDHQFLPACDAYTKAIEKDGSSKASAIFFANRAACYLKLEKYGAVIEDAQNAIKNDKRYTKGYYRLGAGYAGLGDFKKAGGAFDQLLKLKPKDPEALKQSKACKQAVFAAAFAKAISGPEAKPPSETVDLSRHVVDDSYDGPRLGDDGVTLEFVMALIERYRNQKQLHKRYVYEILLQAIQIFKSLPSLVDVPVPKGTHITVCGDVHGQFYDLLNIWRINEMPSEENPYVFNGDFVDRGSFSVEIIVTFLALKCLYPNSFHMTRGNHESRNMNLIYGFKGEVVAKVDDAAFELFSECFDALPLAMVLQQKILVVHGGLFSEDGVKLDQIRKIDRFRQPPDSGLMCELLWSDPQPMPGRAPSKRGVGLSFGPDVTRRFLDDNGLDMIVRSHEVKMDGYEVEVSGRLCTVFSAPNYCDSMGNKGAFIRFEGPDMRPKYTSFPAVPHPNVKPMAYAQPMFQMGM